MTDAEDLQPADWAIKVLEEVLGKAARHAHEREDPSAPVDVTATFQVTALRDEGLLAVRSPGGRGRTIRVAVPAPPT
jgi:hypothetical protein